MQQVLKREIYEETLSFEESETFIIHNFDEARGLIPTLSKLCPKPSTAMIGLTELIINAIEHGNFGLGYKQKKILLALGTYSKEIARRENLPRNLAKFVKVEYTKHNKRVEFIVTDQGAGFDWKPFLDFDPKRLLDPNGRGIASAKWTSFSHLKYIGNGNTAVASFDL